jgi:type II secretory pathway component GspD/PulD (secretin)
MRKRRSRSSLHALDRRLLIGLFILLLITTLTVNSTLSGQTDLMVAAPVITDKYSESNGLDSPETDSFPPDLQQVLSADEMWADVSDTISSPRPSYRSTATISLNVVDADLLDILTTLAYKLDANIIYLEEPVKVTVKIENLTPLDTLQIILQKQGFDYVQVGRNYIVGQSSRLQSDFSNRLVLTRFKLKYVTAEAMQGYLSSLGVQLSSLTVDANKYSLWAKGTPMAICEARELVNALDIKENESITDGEAFFVRYNLDYVVATEMKRYLEEIGVPVLILTVDGNQKSVWMQGVSPALNEARDLIKALDIEENQSITAGDPYLARFELEYVPADVMKKYLSELGVPVKSLTVESNQNSIWLHGIPYALSEAREMIRALDIKENESLADGDAYFVRISLVYVQAESMAGYLSSLNIPVDNILTIEANPQAIWLQGTPIAINKAREMINALDIRENASITEGEEFFIRINLEFVSAGAMKAYLTELDVPVQSILVVDSNQKTIWVQGTSRAINKANELIRALDILENQSLTEGEPTPGPFQFKLCFGRGYGRTSW